MFDAIMYDDGEFEGYDVINPEGDVFFKYRIASGWSPGYNKLLQGAEETIRTVSERRAILEEEARKVYNRGS